MSNNYAIKFERPLIINLIIILLIIYVLVYGFILLISTGEANYSRPYIELIISLNWGYVLITLLTIIYLFKMNIKGIYLFIGFTALSVIFITIKFLNDWYKQTYIDPTDLFTEYLALSALVVASIYLWSIRAKFKS